MLIFCVCVPRFASSSSVAKSSPKAKARNLTPKLPVFSVSSLHSVSSISAISWLSSVVARKLLRMLRCVTSIPLMEERGADL